MARFVLRYRGDALEQAKRRLMGGGALNVLHEEGRNLLVEANEEQLRSAMSDPQEWIISPESQTPPPRPPHPVRSRLGGPPDASA